MGCLLSGLQKPGIFHQAVSSGTVKSEHCIDNICHCILAGDLSIQQFRVKTVGGASQNIIGGYTEEICQARERCQIGRVYVVVRGQHI